MSVNNRPVVVYVVDCPVVVSVYDTPVLVFVDDGIVVVSVLCRHSCVSYLTLWLSILIFYLYKGSRCVFKY